MRTDCVRATFPRQSHTKTRRREDAKVEPDSTWNFEQEVAEGAEVITSSTLTDCVRATVLSPTGTTGNRRARCPQRAANVVWQSQRWTFSVGNVSGNVRLAGTARPAQHCRLLFAARLIPPDAHGVTVDPQLSTIDSQLIFNHRLHPPSPKRLWRTGRWAQIGNRGRKRAACLDNKPTAQTLSPDGQCRPRHPAWASPQLSPVENFSLSS
jgi:hypothetical protein